LEKGLLHCLRIELSVRSPGKAPAFPHRVLREDSARYLQMDAITKRPLAPKEPLGEERVALYEDEAISQANELITMLEAALAKWDSSGLKPEAMKERFESFRVLLGRLTEWERDALLSKRRQEPMRARQERLREYVEIVKSFRVVA
jgi:hypothetical protein